MTKESQREFVRVLVVGIKLFSFEGSEDPNKSGDNDEVAPPVPMPNTEVKHFNADNSKLATTCEDM